MTQFKELKKELTHYLKTPDIKKIEQAYQFGAEAHQHQKRHSGEPYITHPLSVALILAQMRMDPDTIMAAILHDVIEDTGVAKGTLAEQFGAQVAELVDGVSKLTQISFESRAMEQAENFRKMVLAMSRDIRVILVKLADRLHNMRTLGHLRSEKRHRIARETLEIYAPIANRLGMHAFYLEFEDLCFAAIYPMRHRVLAQVMKKKHGQHKKFIKSIESQVKKKLKEWKIKDAVVMGRKKYLHSIYRKMKTKQVGFDDVMDVFGFRLIVPRITDCYQALGAMHHLFKPLPERFKDYVAIPKTNGYQSLHTTLFGPDGVPIEIQIRTEEMHLLAENGIASHWLYKTNDKLGNAAHQRAQVWLKNLMDLQRNTGSSLEFIENVKIDLFPDEVYVFTPRGDIIKLPRGASAVDFAYAVHSDVGNACVAARIDRQLMPLSTKLINGQTIEVVTAPSARPNPAWLNFVVTGKARSNIRHLLKERRQAETVQFGESLLEQALGSQGASLASIPKKNLKQVLAESEFSDASALYEAIGLGNQMPMLVARRLLQGVSELTEDSAAVLPLSPLLIKGSEGLVVKFAPCCQPIPGDAIIGHLDKGKGFIIHRVECAKVAKTSFQQEHCIEARWEASVSGEFNVSLYLEVFNRRGMLAMLAQALNEAESNIIDITVSEKDGRYCALVLMVQVRSRVHLARVMRRLRAIKDVMRLVRMRDPHDRT